jgi:MFS family permease
VTTAGATTRNQTSKEVVSTTESLGRTRLSISTMFLLHAAVSGTWAPRVPALKAQSHLTNGELGLALLGMAAGLLAGTRSAGGPVDRYGSRPILRGGLPLLCAALLLPALANGLLTLAAAFFALGFASGGLDVAMNAQGVAVERSLGRPILNGLHGLWSVGLGMGAGAAVLAAAVGAQPILHFTVVGAMIAGMSLPALRSLLGGRAQHAAAEEESANAPVGVWSAAVLLLGAISFCSLIGEGSAADWSAVYLRGSVGTSAAVAATGFAAFSVATAASRFAADRLVAVLGPIRLVRLASLTAAAGLATGLVVNQPALAIMGFALLGAGLGPVVPIAFSAAGRIGGTASGRVLGRVVTFGYVGSVLGPLVIGGLSELTSLRLALFLPALLALLIAAGARWVAPAQAA